MIHCRSNFSWSAKRRWSLWLSLLIFFCCTLAQVVHGDTLDVIPWKNRSRLNANEKVSSNSNEFEMFLSPNGNLSLLRKVDNVMLWNNGVTGPSTPPHFTEFQGDANLITRETGTNTRKWKSDKTGPGDGSVSYFMAVNTDESELGIYIGTVADYQELWVVPLTRDVSGGGGGPPPTPAPIVAPTPAPIVAPTPAPIPVAQPTQAPVVPPSKSPTKAPVVPPTPPTTLPEYDVLLRHDQEVQAGEIVSSASGQYRLTMKSEGIISVIHVPTGKEIFNNDKMSNNGRNTANSDIAHKCRLQGDSNWVMREASTGRTRWKSDVTRDPTKKYQVVVQTSTERLMIFPENNYAGAPIWTSQPIIGEPIPTPPPVPVVTPTIAPVVMPTPKAPTKAPVPAPTKAPVPAPTKAPVPAPTKAPPSSIPSEGLDFLMKNGDRLGPDTTITSEGGHFTLTMQRNGRLVATQVGGGEIWNNGFANPGKSHQATLQGDANFLVRESGGRVVWKSDQTSDPTQQYMLVVDYSDKKLYIYHGTQTNPGIIIWPPPPPRPTQAPPPRRPTQAPPRPPPPPPPGASALTTFYAIADVPYTDGQRGTMERYVRDIPGDARFCVHLGDIKPRDNDCTRRRYQQVADSLKASSTAMFIIIGDNEFNDCPNPQQALNDWNAVFNRFDERHWNSGLDVRRGSREGTFWFINKRTLFIGLHLPGSSYRTCCDWDNRIASQASFAIDTMRAQRSRYDGVVMFGHAVPSSSHRRFFEPVQDYVSRNSDVPFLYMGGDSHKWTWSKNFRGQRNFWHIVVSPGVEERPLRMRVDPAKYGVNMDQAFQVQRR